MIQDSTATKKVSSSATMDSMQEFQERPPRESQPRRIEFLIGLTVMAIVLAAIAGNTSLGQSAVAGPVFLLVMFCAMGVLAVSEAILKGRRLQFSLKDGLLSVALLSLLLAAGVAWGLAHPVFIVVGIVVAGYGVVRTEWGREVLRAQMLPEVFLLFLMLLCLVGALLPGIGSTTVAPRSVCAIHLKQISLALNEYHDMYGVLPPAYVADREGRPMHSWRVLLLPFLEQQALYDLYDFSEPWNGPHNSRLATMMPPEYGPCPSDSNAVKGETSYLAVIGQGTVWPGPKSQSLKSITNTSAIMVVESEDSGINWLEPRDFNLGHASRGINSKFGRGISSHHGKGANVALADGNIQFLEDSLPEAALRDMLLIEHDSNRRATPND